MSNKVKKLIQNLLLRLQCMEKDDVYRYIPIYKNENQKFFLIKTSLDPISTLLLIDIYNAIKTGNFYKFDENSNYLKDNINFPLIIEDVINMLIFEPENFARYILIHYYINIDILNYYDNNSNFIPNDSIVY